MFDSLQYQSLFVSWLEKELSRVAGISGLGNALAYAMDPHGKLIRPVLMLRFGDVCKLEQNKLESPSVAIELLHLASLIHDDLPCIDNDLTRRGKDSLHVRVGEGIAVLCGDWLIARSFRIISVAKTLNLQEKTSILAILSTAFCRLTEGQARDLELQVQQEQKSVNVLEKQFIEVYKAKTGALFRAVAEIILALTSKHELQRERGEFLSWFEDLGLLFQLTDDLIECKENSSKVERNLLNVVSRKRMLEIMNSTVDEMDRLSKGLPTLSPLLSEITWTIASRAS